MSKYFKFPAESDLSIGIQYIEFNDEGWPIRPVRKFMNVSGYSFEAILDCRNTVCN
jgi:hypothetical protein